MAQVNLSGESIEEAKERERQTQQRDWVMKQVVELKAIRDNIEYYDNLSREPRDEYGHQPFYLERHILGAWWYCNHIVGWDNNVPYYDPSKEYVPMVYSGAAENGCMADSIRDCFLAVRRDGVKWDKAFALRRLDKAIESYERDLVDPNPVRLSSARVVKEDKMETEMVIEKPNFSIEEVGIYDDEDYDTEPTGEDEDGTIDTGVDDDVEGPHDKVIRGRSKQQDKAQAKLDAW